MKVKDCSQSRHGRHAGQGSRKCLGAMWAECGNGLGFSADRSWREGVFICSSLSRSARREEVAGVQLVLREAKLKLWRWDKVICRREQGCILLEGVLDWTIWSASL